MDDGFISWIMIIILFILLASGWKEVLLCGLSNRAIFLFLILWICSSFVTFSFFSISMNLGYFIILITMMVLLISIKGFFDRLHWAAVGLFLGTLIFVLRMIAQVNPGIEYNDPFLHVYVISSLLIALLVKDIRQLLITLFIGMIMADIFSIYVNLESTPLFLGNFSFYDQVWLTGMAAVAFFTVKRYMISYFSAFLL